MKDKVTIPKLIWRTNEPSPEAGQPVVPPPQILRTRQQVPDNSNSKPQKDK